LGGVYDMVIHTNVTTNNWDCENVSEIEGLFGFFVDESFV
jgi:hypothetical protein